MVLRFLKRLHVFLALLAFLALSASCSFSMGRNAKVYIVGIACNYGCGSGLMYLPATTNDAKEFCLYYKKALDVKGISNRLFLMLDERVPSKDGSSAKYVYTDPASDYAPTVGNITALLRSFATGSEYYDKLNEDDLLVVFYSGHGSAPSSSKEYSYESTGAFILPDYGNGGVYLNDPSYVRFKNADFVNILKELPCQVALICDSCHSGHIVGVISENGERIDDPAYDIGSDTAYAADFSHLAKTTNVSGIFAAPAAKQSYADDGGIVDGFNDEAHSLFTGFLLTRAMGWTHSNSVFCTTPSSRTPAGGVFCSLEPGTVVYGTPLSDGALASMRLSLSDMASACGSFGIYGAYQRSVISLGPTTRYILW